MANSKLENRSFVFPKHLLPYINQNVGGQGNLSERLLKFIERQQLTYYEMKNFLSDYSIMSDSDKLKNGGKVFYNWVLTTLNNVRKRVQTHKQNMTVAGFSNQYKKIHDKDLPDERNVKKIQITEEQYKTLFI